MNDANEKIPVDLIDKEIDRLLARLAAKGVCPCCAATAMMYHGAYLYEAVVDSEAALGILADIVEAIADDAEMPVDSTQH